MKSNEFDENSPIWPIAEKAIEKWGKTAQLLTFFEEIGELFQAINKHERAILSNQRLYETRGNIEEEVADVMIMLYQICQVYELESQEINEIIQEKLDRMEARLNE